MVDAPSLAPRPPLGAGLSGQSPLLRQPATTTSTPNPNPTTTTTTTSQHVGLSQPPQLQLAGQLTTTMPLPVGHCQDQGLNPAGDDSRRRGSQAAQQLFAKEPSQRPLLVHPPGHGPVPSPVAAPAPAPAPPPVSRAAPSSIWGREGGVEAASSSFTPGLGSAQAARWALRTPNALSGSHMPLIADVVYPCVHVLLTCATRGNACCHACLHALPGRAEDVSARNVIHLAPSPKLLSRHAVGEAGAMAPSPVTTQPAHMARLHGSQDTAGKAGTLSPLLAPSQQFTTRSHASTLKPGDQPASPLPVHNSAHKASATRASPQTFSAAQVLAHFLAFVHAPVSQVGHRKISDPGDSLRHVMSGEWSERDGLSGHGAGTDSGRPSGRGRGSGNGAGDIRVAKPGVGLGPMRAWLQRVADAIWLPPVILPHTHGWYRRWLHLVAAAAVIAAIVEPFVAAFSHEALWCGSLGTIQSVITTSIFTMDMVLMFRVAYQVGGILRPACTSSTVHEIAWQYATTMFGWDLLFTFPFTWAVLSQDPSMGGNLQASHALMALVFLRLGWLYRLVPIFEALDKAMVLGQLALILLRSGLVLLFSCHWFACAFYLVARVEAAGQSQGGSSWVGNAWFRFDDLNTMSRYVLSMYFAVGSFAGLGDGDLHAVTPAEAVAVILFLSYNLFAVSYITGKPAPCYPAGVGRSITMLIIKGDKRMERFRDKRTQLSSFAKKMAVPQVLTASMQEHLEMEHKSDQAPDEQVLSIYPSCLRRAVMRHIYGNALRMCYLFRGCSAMFLDAVMSMTCVELFMPYVTIINEGDVMNELFVIVSGTVEINKQGASATAAIMSRKAGLASHNSYTTSFTNSMGDSQNFSLRKGRSGGKSMAGSRSGSQSARGGTSSARMAGVQNTVLTTNDVFGDLAFLADVSSAETVISTSLVKVLTLRKPAYDILVTRFPEEIRIVNDNLLKKAEGDMRVELATAADSAQLSPRQLEVIKQYTMGDLSPSDMPPDIKAEVKASLTVQQVVQMESLDEVKSMVRTYAENIDKLRIYSFLNAAAAGNVEAVRTMVDKDLSVDCMVRQPPALTPYHPNHSDSGSGSLGTGASTTALRRLCSAYLRFEAVRTGQDACINILLDHGAEGIGRDVAQVPARCVLPGCPGCRLGLKGVFLASQLCNCVFEKDYLKLRRMMRAGADHQCGGTTTRAVQCVHHPTPPHPLAGQAMAPLHIMAAEADIKGVRLLLEVGGAMVDTKDRWGHTALDEAKRVNASPVIAYLAPLMLLAAEGKIRCAAKPMAPRLQVLMATQPALLLTAGFPRPYLTPGASQV
ncbi:hypothetical protein QJQ45_020813 [Haematococcus lacustris]|nr:hypothetical protein QJQ45_020813 [Haematococcus lacustris]